jgi:hypothetical protein
MNTIRMCAVTAAAMLLICGCVQITQEVHINHDGSGKIVEKITVLPRGVRLLEGMKKRKGGSGVPVLLSEEAFQKRLKAMGGVSVEKKEDVTLEDGRRQIETVYTFKNISNVVFWTAPTLSHKNTQKTRGGHNPNYQGKLTLNFRPEYERFGKLYKETVEIKASTSHQMPGQPRSSPAEQQKYRRVLPIFQDMIKDFKYSIVAVAPIESFEEPRRMLQNVRYDGNRVTVYELDGRGVIQAGDMIHQLIMREVVGPEMSRHQRSAS